MFRQIKLSVSLALLISAIALVVRSQSAAQQTADFADPQKQQVTRYSYDAMNRLTSQTNGLGVETRHAYDLVGNRVALYWIYQVSPVDLAWDAPVAGQRRPSTPL